MQPLEATLAQHGHNITRARKRVFKALQSSPPLTIQELIGRCAGIDRASVYRTVALFEELAIIERVPQGWKYRLELSDSFRAHHHHATCLACGRSLEIAEDTRLEVRVYELADKLGFRLERHQLELQGYCPECQDQGSYS